VNKTVKISIVALLLLAVGSVIAMKNNGANDASPQQATAQSSDNIQPQSAEVAIPHLLDLGAGKCVPCRMMKPILEQLTKDYEGRMRVTFVDVWENPDAGEKYGVRIIPTQIFYDAQGKELFRHEGFYSREDILAKWKELGVTFEPKATLPAQTKPDITNTPAATKPAAMNTTDQTTVAQSQPLLASGNLSTARLVNLPEGVVLRADAISITSDDLQVMITGAPEQMQPQLKQNQVILLEQAVTEKIILDRAKKALVNDADAQTLNDQQIIKRHFEQITADAKVTESDMKEFYESNRSMMGDATLDQVRGQLEPFLLGQAKQKRVDNHINTTVQQTSIQIDAKWFETHARLALDNPVDQARGSGKPSMIDFGAHGCGPCDMMTPILETLSKKYADKAHIVFVPVREQQLLASRYGIQSIPTQIFYDAQGNEVFRHTGFLPQDQIEAKLAKYGVQ
jgi:thioredoxin 1